MGGFDGRSESCHGKNDPNLRYSVNCDPNTGRVDARIFGMWDMAVVDPYLRELAQCVSLARTNRSAIDLMIDLSASKVQSPDIAERTRDGAVALMRDGDRVVMVVGTMLGTLQLKRLAPTSVGVVSTREEAEAFLRRDAGTPPES